MTLEMTTTDASPNHLYFGDNLDILRQYIADESVDLIYLDPPFNSNATYNVCLPRTQRRRIGSADHCLRRRLALGLEKPNLPTRN